MTFPRLPEFPLSDSVTETYVSYGLRVLQFVIAHRVTATLTDLQLEAADHAYPIAVARPDLSAAVHVTLADARWIIQRARRARIALAPVVPPVEPPCTPVPPSNGGSRVSVPTAPKINPTGPQGAAVAVPERIF